MNRTFNLKIPSLSRLEDFLVSQGVCWLLQNQPVNRLQEHSQEPSKLIRQARVDNSEAGLSFIQTLEQLRQALLGLSNCPLRASANQLVFGSGDPSAPIMLIGEAPGAEEDQQGIPFVGQSGQLLTAILKSIRLKREAVYITNVVPWRPPANRPPSTDEISFYFPYLKRHIELVSPQILILLGSVAVKTILDRSQGITQLRGQTLVCPFAPSIHCIPTYHPAYLLRSPGQKALVWRDFLRIQKLIKKLGIQFSTVQAA
jgi:uracil-DNA glycosylase family 4